MYNRKQIKLDARKQLSENFWYLFKIQLALIAVGAIESVIVSSNEWFSQGSAADVIFGIVSALVSIAYFFVSFTLSVEAARYNLRAVRGDLSADLKESLFEDFKNEQRFVQEMTAMLQATVYVVLGFICLIVPGIILALRYSLLHFVFAENPDISRTEALRRCKDMMQGKLWDYFVFQLSFLLWYFFGLVTCFIGMIYVIPYVENATARYYLCICGAGDREETMGGDAPSFGGGDRFGDVPYGGTGEGAPKDVGEDSSPFDELK